MKIDEKRRAVEVLMHASCVGQLMAVTGANREFHRIAKLRTAVADELSVWSYAFTNGYRDACLEAAYRLIESSPTLRREWFTTRGTP